MRLIDADEAVKRIAKEQDKATTGTEDVTYYRAIKIIREQPTIEVEPVKHGSWVKHRIEKYDNYGNYTNAPGPTVCSNCNFSAYGIAEIYNFCPQCGARMDGDTNEEP